MEAPEPAPAPPVSNSRKLAFLAAFVLLGLIVLAVWSTGKDGWAGIAALVIMSAALLRFSFTGRRPRGEALILGALAILALSVLHLVLTV